MIASELAMMNEQMGKHMKLKNALAGLLAAATSLLMAGSITAVGATQAN